MAFLCPSKFKRNRRRKAHNREAPRPGRITGSASIDTLVRVNIEKEELYSEGKAKVIVLQDFKPCVEDELSVSRGDIVTLLYKENDWIYVIAHDGQEGFIPFIYCSAPSGCIANNSTNINKSYSLDDSDDRIGSVSPSKLSYGQLNRSSSISLPSLTRAMDSSSNDGQDSSENLISNSSSPDIMTYATPFQKNDHGLYMVMFRFQASEEDDISVDKAEIVNLLNCDDPDWFWICRSDKREGFVPSKYLCPAEGFIRGSESLPRSRNAKNTLIQTVDKRNRTFNLLSQNSQTETKLVCLYDYKSSNVDDITIYQGQCVYAKMSDQSDPDWLFVYNPLNKMSGFIPKSYVKEYIEHHSHKGLISSKTKSIIL